MLTPLLSGLFVWSLGHYVIHRTLHSLISNKHKSSLTLGENNHHTMYDRGGRKRKADAGARFITFPYNITLLVLVCLSLILLLIDVRVSLYFCLGFLFGMFLDDTVHNLYHLNVKTKIAFVDKIVSLHKIHHKHKNCNYGFCCGLIYDFLFRTIRYH